MRRKNADKGVRRLLSAFRYALAGIKGAFKDEAAFRQDVLLFVLAAPIAFWIEASAGARALMVGSLFLILIAELVNSAIEATIDRISSEDHVLSKKAKDIGSAVVLIAFLNFLCVWGIIIAG